MWITDVSQRGGAVPRRRDSALLRDLHTLDGAGENAKV